MTPKHHNHSYNSMFNVRSFNVKGIICDTSTGGQNGHSSTRGQDGGFNMPVGSITRARAKRLRDSFGNLAQLIVKEIH